MKTKIQKLILGIFAFTAITGLNGCRKFLDVGDPQNLVVANYAYNSDNSAILIVTDLYYDVQANWAQGINGFSINLGASADELNVVPNSSPYSYYLNSAGGDDYWGRLWTTLYKCNAAIEGLEGSEKLSNIVKTQLLGEAKFMRAFTYFYLVNLFGDIPLLTTIDYQKNSKAHRSSTETIYRQIIEDLKEAREILNLNYVANDVRTPINVRVRPNKAAASALLARVYLYIKDWANAEALASEVINDNNYELLSNLDLAFLTNSKEAIWQLEPQTGGFDGIYRNNADARYFVLNAAPNDSDRPVWLNPHLVREFEAGDKRSENWIAETNIDYPLDAVDKPQFKYPFKYKVNSPGLSSTEYVTVMRIAEQYLIRAEARINSGRIAEGIADLNIIRAKRRNNDIANALPDLSAALSLEQANLAVEHERQVELFTEWGHRWLDLKRTNRIDQVMSTLSPKKYDDPWLSYRKLFSTPSGEMILNENLGQTQGYPM